MEQLSRGERIEPARPIALSQLGDLDAEDVADEVPKRAGGEQLEPGCGLRVAPAARIELGGAPADPAVVDGEGIGGASRFGPAAVLEVRVERGDGVGRGASRRPPCAGQLRQPPLALLQGGSPERARFACVIATAQPRVAFRFRDRDGLLHVD